MGYSTRILGELEITPPLTTEQVSRLNDFVQERHDEEGFPYYYCHWFPSDDGKTLSDESDCVSNYHYVDWLKYLIHHFFNPWGCKLNGTVHWEGEENSDMGKIEVHENSITVFEAVIGYSRVNCWSPGEPL